MASELGRSWPLGAVPAKTGVGRRLMRHSEKLLIPVVIVFGIGAVGGAGGVAGLSRVYLAGTGRGVDEDAETDCGWFAPASSARDDC